MIGIISDDITGCGDIGIYLAERGLIPLVITLYKKDIKLKKLPQAIILNTESRNISPKRAYNRLREAFLYLRRIKANKIYKKIDSTLRGNIGEELNALFEITNINFLPFVPAFPKMGRKTINGYHYLYNKLITDTEFKNDPTFPVKEAHIPTLLQNSCRFSSYIKVYDIKTENDLKLLSKKIYKHKVICGAARLLKYLIPYWFRNTDFTKRKKRYISLKGPVCIICGSAKKINATQINELKDRPDLSVIDLISNRKSTKENVLIYPSKSLNLSSSIIQEKIASQLKKILQYKRFTHFILVGGETSFNVLKLLGVKRFHIISSFEPGIALCKSKEKNIDFILKPGGFGNRYTLKKAYRYFTEP